MTDRPPLDVGTRIAVRTPDRREFRGVLVEFRTDANDRAVAVVRLDTGWLTTYPLAMVHALDDPSADA